MLDSQEVVGFDGVWCVIHYSILETTFGSANVKRATFTFKPVCTVCHKSVIIQVQFHSECLGRLLDCFPTSHLSFSYALKYFFSRLFHFIMFLCLLFAGLSRVEKNRFSAMKNSIQILKGPEQQVQTVKPVQKPVKAFYLQYTYPKCPQPKYIKGKRNITYHVYCSSLRLSI